MLRRLIAIVAALITIVSIMTSAVFSQADFGMPILLASTPNIFVVALPVLALCVLSLRFAGVTYLILPALLLFGLSQVSLSYHYSINGFRYTLFAVPLSETVAAFDLEDACYALGPVKLTFEGPVHGDRIELWKPPWPLVRFDPALASWPQCQMR